MMPFTAWCVELEPGRCWLARWTGDPGRTTVETSAKRFPSQPSAERALRQARRYHPFNDAVVREVVK
ncbi:MAG TPA: hypothetical protein P5330_11995 [Candidatus Competibacteraceae bacterium]|nr:hypothetical protein [Candidatus Competibacteraceae bacterium]